MFLAAFLSLLWIAPQWGQTHSLSDNWRLVVHKPATAEESVYHARLFPIRIYPVLIGFKAHSFFL